MNIFDASHFMPRFMCINKDTSLMLLYVLPNIGIWLVYSFGFAWLWMTLMKKSVWAKLPFLPLLLTLMAMFFFFCGGTHFNDAIAMVWPAYWFFMIWEWIQFFIALVALVYAVNLIKKYVT